MQGGSNYVTGSVLTCFGFYAKSPEPEPNLILNLSILSLPASWLRRSNRVTVVQYVV